MVGGVWVQGAVGRRAMTVRGSRKEGWVQRVVARSGECKGWWEGDGTRSGSKEGECKGW